MSFRAIHPQRAIAQTITAALALTLVVAGCGENNPGDGPGGSDDGGGGTTASGGAGGSGGEGGGATACNVVIDEDITADRTIEAGCVVSVTETVAIVDDATLTLEPGVRVEMATGVSIDVGDDTPGKLIAAGTATNPITITSANDTPAPGDWWAIEINDTVMGGTAFSHVIFEYGGGNPDDYYPGALHFPNPEEIAADRVSVDACTFRHSAGAGIGMDDMASADPPPGLFASFTGNTFENNTEYAIIARPHVFSALGADNTLDQPVLVTDGWYEVDAPWPNLGVPYVLEGSVDVYDGGHLQLDGLVVQGLSGGEITVYLGKLTAHDVTFESAYASPSPGDWRGFTNVQSSNIHLSNCTISHVNGGAYAPDAVIAFAYEADALASTIVGTTFSDNIGPSDIQTDGSATACAAFENANPPNAFDLSPACL